MEKKKNSWLFSINTRIIGAIMSCALCIAAGISVFTYFHLNTVLSKAATSEMNLFCADKGYEIDASLITIENCVNSLSSFASEEAGTADNLKNSKTERDSILSRINSLILFMCEQIPHSNDVYFHYTVEVTGEGNLEEGIFFSKDDSGEFSELPITQIQQATAEEDTIWYTTPLKTGHALWMKPHLDGSIHDIMLSYVTPVYCGNDAIAVIGIDINFSKLIEELDQIKYKNTGYLYLKAGDGSIHYHPGFSSGEAHGDEADYLIENGYLMTSTETKEGVIRYQYHNTDRVMVFVTLRNGMKLVLCDSYDDIFAARNQAITTTILISVGFTLFFVIIAAILAHRINSPLRHLAKTATAISKDLNAKVDFPKEGRDEVGDLNRAFKIGIKEIQSQHKLLEHMAYYDHLTKVRNGASYSKATTQLNEDIDKKKAVFGIVMLDVNFLKDVNDHYGHAIGDFVLAKCAELIAEAFADDEVFRIGGDEFVVILRGDRTDHAEECLGFLDRLIEHNNESADKAFKKLSISYGYAAYDPKKDHRYEDVYRRADRKMYDMKHRVHLGRRKR